MDRLAETHLRFVQDAERSRTFLDDATKMAKQLMNTKGFVAQLNQLQPSGRSVSTLFGLKHDVTKLTLGVTLMLSPDDDGYVLFNPKEDGEKVQVGTTEEAASAIIDIMERALYRHWNEPVRIEAG